ncbi:MFS transporter [Chromobacterium subtsugae]|uniref:MFS transporter n=1 Tax=Chromobacterium subtsugae TaxID=251747 RepID=A0ABS7F908_9NEIS|nr:MULTISPECIES: MFS transporter [Chromobacterium]MBW7564901.1 MFS transporter [Chromobacterium subtsugae]MBW8286572.1 MFS transporter [Chromobacterium subtsugae]WSE91386.1 MFS transporter [Chromobacterium subtsugae]WVH59761.1 MFS transporter [Chromobacterium subtsugae]
MALAALRAWWADLSGPFAYRTFTVVWLTSLAANVGYTVQGVGASWAMASMAPTPTMVALVQTAASVPIALFALLSGVAADAWDRRAVMLASQALVFAVAAALTGFSAAGYLAPAMILACTFLNGCGAALFQPTWQSSVAEQVPRSQLSAAIALDSFSLNFARAAGPAFGGLIVARFTPGAAFLISALAGAVMIAALLSWKRPPPRRHPREKLLAALAGGVAYCWRARRMRDALFRSALFGFLGSPVWALLPLFAKQQFGGAAGTYGMLLAAFGVGATAGALGGAALRARHAKETVVRGGAFAFGLGIIAAAVSPALPGTLLGLSVAGASWVASVSTFNLSIQTGAPDRLAGRALSLFHSCIIGGMSLGSFAWGCVAEPLGVGAALLMSGLLMSASCLLGWLLPLAEADEPDAVLAVSGAGGMDGHCK